MNANMIHKNTLCLNSHDTYRKYSICTPKIPVVKNALSPVKDINHLGPRRIVPKRLGAELQQRQHHHQHEPTEKTQQHPYPPLKTSEVMRVSCGSISCTFIRNMRRPKLNAPLIVQNMKYSANTSSYT